MSLRQFTSLTAFLAHMELYMARQLRADKTGPSRTSFDRAKKKILATQTICGICGKPVDFNAKFPAPLSPVIDHIIPIARGGHPYDMDNLQLAHFCCNRAKADKLVEVQKFDEKDNLISNRNLPQTMDWALYKA